jgi:hypothetical protein
MVPKRGTPNPTDTWTEDNLLRPVLYKSQREEGPDSPALLSRTLDGLSFTLLERPPFPRWLAVMPVNAHVA